MKLKSEDKIQAEIRKRAYARWDVLRRQKQNILRTRHTLEALQDVTGLSRLELENVATEARAAQEAIADEFFSIKNQLFLVLGAVAVLLLFSGFTLKWIF